MTMDFPASRLARTEEYEGRGEVLVYLRFEDVHDGYHLPRLRYLLQSVEGLLDIAGFRGPDAAYYPPERVDVDKDDESSRVDPSSEAASSQTYAVIGGPAYVVRRLSLASPLEIVTAVTDSLAFAGAAMELLRLMWEQKLARQQRQRYVPARQARDDTLDLIYTQVGVMAQGGQVDAKKLSQAISMMRQLEDLQMRAPDA